MKRSLILISSVVALFVAITVVANAAAQVRVIDIVPNSQSNETATDSEPNIAVDPSNPLRIAASAFTPNPLPNLTNPTAPIYVSADGGATWTLNCIVPVPVNDPIYGTEDITLRFGGSSSVLYAGILNPMIPNDYLHGTSLNLNVLRTADVTLATPMELLFNRWAEDQPYVQATTVLGGSGTGSDRVYVGSNHIPMSLSQTAAIDRSLDAATLPARPFFPSVRLLSRREPLRVRMGRRSGPPFILTARSTLPFILGEHGQTGSRGRPG